MNELKTIYNSPQTPVSCTNSDAVYLAVSDLANLLIALLSIFLETIEAIGLSEDIDESKVLNVGIVYSSNPL